MGEVKGQKFLFISKILHLSAFFHCSRFYEQTLPLTRSARWSPDRDAGSRRYLDTVTPAASLSTSHDLPGELCFSALFPGFEKSPHA